jgi:hypothetical protein
MTIGELVRRVRAFIQRDRLDADLQEEMRLHVELRARANARDEADTAEAYRAARVRFGSPGAIREARRDLWGAGWRDRLGQDARYAVRQLSRRPLSTLVVVGTLALGIGANTAMFTFLDVALFRAAPVADPDRLAWIVSQNERGRFENVSYPNYAAFRDRVSSSPACWRSRTAVSLGGATARRVGQIVSANAFDVLGVRAELGRVHLRRRSWRAARRPPQRRSLAPPTAPIAIVRPVVSTAGRCDDGVAPADSTGPAARRQGRRIVAAVSSVAVAMPGERRPLEGCRSQLAPRDWTPRSQCDGRSRAGQRRGGCGRAALDRAITVSDRRSGGLDPSIGATSPGARRLAIVPVLVLLVACANVANVRSRAVDRRRAGDAARARRHARLVRQLLTEYLMLALPAAAAAGLVPLISAIVRISHMPASMAVVSPDTRVLATARSGGGRGARVRSRRRWPRQGQH